MSIPYRFMPWVRRGLARSHTTEDTLTGELPISPANVRLTLKAKGNGANPGEVSGAIGLHLYGPGHVIGFDPRLIVRTEPKSGEISFEPNYLVAIDFDPPDFPWLMTPAKARGQNLRPWLVLVVLNRTDNKNAVPRLQPGRPLPSISLTSAQVATELPDLKESWLWAHTQAVSEAPDGKKEAEKELAKQYVVSEFKNKPERNISRLVCPRRLSPNKDYVACVVPAFDAGSRCGLGLPVLANAALVPAWDLAAPMDIELPVYTYWEFSTGETGDFEELARRLKTPDKYQNDIDMLAKLRQIGVLPVAVDGDHLLFKGSEPGVTKFEGALVSHDFTPEPADETFAMNLENILNSGNAQANNGSTKDPKSPTLSPPIYGEYPANRHVVVKEKVVNGTVDQHWLDQLNLQPRYRLAAGWGAELVRTHQDEFMQAAWEQMGDVKALERALSMSRLARDVLKVIERRHLNKLPDHRLLALIAPARAHIKLAPGETLFGRIGKATLPDEFTDGAMRRLTSARRPSLRMALRRNPNAGRQSISVQMGALVSRFTNATQNLDAIDPNRFSPDGISESRSFDRITLFDDPATLIDLQPYTGLPGSMASGEIRKIQEANAAARVQGMSTPRTVPKMSDVWHDGLLTETHYARLAELEQAAGGPLRQNDMEQMIKQASQSGAEGVLLTVQQDGQVSAQSLKIDARSGKLTTFGAVRGAPMPRAARLAPGGIGAVPIGALRKYGNDAVFASLPVNSLGQSVATIDIRLEAPGRFTPVAVAPVAQVIPSITLPPAIKDREVLQRYVEAFKNYQELFRDPLSGAGVTIQPVDFAMQQSVSEARARINPDQTVPKRLASMLALGDHSVSWSEAKGFNSPHIASYFGADFLGGPRYVIPPRFDRVMAYPHLVMPLAKKLEILAPAVFLPGVGSLPDNFIMAVKTNPRFVEALMVGANHEMGRELLWQGFPTDQRGTPFQRFWQRFDGGVDIQPVNEWPKKPLGEQPGNESMLVLLIRGQLLVRFPNISIYAYPIEGTEKRPGGSIPPPAPGIKDDKEMLAGKIVRPVMGGHLGKDIRYFGFDSNEISPDPELGTEKSMAKFFFVLEEQMTEPRFGFDETRSAGDPDTQQPWRDIAWGDVDVLNGQHFGSVHLKRTPAAKSRESDWVTPHAGLTAQALLQRPFRGFYHGTKLVLNKK